MHLNRPWQGLYVLPMIWVAEVNFDPGSVWVVLSSHTFAESDYIRDYETYQALV